MNENTCSNKGTLNEMVDVTLRHIDDKPELTNSYSVDDSKWEWAVENGENIDIDPNGETSRIRKLTEKGKGENVRRLKQKRINALSAVTRKRTDITELMTDRNNLDVVKMELTQLDSLCQQFYEAHNRYHDQLSTLEERENASHHYESKEKDIFEYRKRVANWILECEARIGDQLENLSGSSQSHRSRTSRSSRSSSLHSARLKEKAKIAELLAERSLLEERLKLQAAEKQLQLDLEIAKAKARETAIAEMEEENMKRPKGDLESFVPLPSPLPRLNHETRPPGMTAISGTKVKLKHEANGSIPLNPEVPEFHYHAFPYETKKENETQSNSQNEVLRETFKLQLEQMQAMISSQNQIATAISLPQPQIPKFNGDAMEFRTFIMAFDARINSKVVSSADKLYYLDQHLEGEPKELVAGCLHVEPNAGYAEALRLLEKEYGDPYKVFIAYMQKLSDWPVIKFDDSAALKRFSFFLTKCSNAMRSIAHMAVLNHSPNMQAVVLKLPPNLQTKWLENVVNARLERRRVAGFDELAKFVERASEVANDPVYGRDALKSVKIKSRTAPEESKKLPPPRYKSSSFATDLQTNLASLDRSGAGSSYQNASGAIKCPLCSKAHDLEDCVTFKKKSVEERRAFVTEKALCFACYGSNHISKHCRKKRICSNCKKPHPTLLHVDGFSLNKEASENGKEKKSDEKPAKVNNACIDLLQNLSNSDAVVLQTILPVLISNKDTNQTVKTYAFYDNGSAGCFLTESLRKRLAVEGIKTTLQLGTMHGRNLVESTIVEGLVVTDLNGKSPIELPRAYTRDEIPVDHDQIPTPEVVRRFNHLEDIANEIPNYDPSMDIGLLIGSNCPTALVPLSVLPSKGDGPYAVKLNHGWTVNGPLHVSTDSTTNKVTVNKIVVRETDSIKEIVTPKSLLKMFELDFGEYASNNLPEELGHSQEDRKFLTKVSNGIQLTRGHYEIPLPFRQSDVNLPNNREQAVKRAFWQRRKMLQNDQYREDYIAFITETVDKGYVEKVPEESLEANPGKVWYIPHHGVYHPKKPGKIRVVFDCSAKFAGTSLNDQLLQGPDLTNSLVGVLTRFRQEPVAFMGDIEAMFYQVLVPPEQRNFLRFLWWPNGDLNANFAEYRMTVHPFGAVSSPSCSNYALRKTANDNEEKYGSAVASTMRRNFYVDDCLRSVSTEAKAKEQIESLRKACMEGGFRLTKFICNRRNVLESIPEEERSKDVKKIDLNCDDLPIERALGVQWCVESDTFQFRIVIKDKPLTRRGILSIVSSIYDPLGFVAPFTLTAKRLLQDLCREEKLGWDDELSEPYRLRWENWRIELPLLERINVPRCQKPTDFGEVKSRQIHIFSDASSVGFGCAAYLRLLDTEDRIHCSFLMGKARLAPIKALTTPRLELTAATVSVRLGRMLDKDLDDKPDTVQYHTDSKTVLRYINNDQKRFQVFVANRVQLIRNLSDPSQWRYVETKKNPADDASRGLGAKTLDEQHRWLRGPNFLWQPEDEWPAQPSSFGEIPMDDPDVKKPVNVSVVTLKEPSPVSTVMKLLYHFSDWYRLKKAVAVFMRVKMTLQKRRLKMVNARRGLIDATNGKSMGTDEDRQPLRVEELEAAELAVIRFVQSQNFSFIVLVDIVKRL